MAPMPDGRVAVTGAGGFIGGRLVEILARAGVQTQALVRTGLEAPRLEALGCSTFRGDVTIPATLTQFVSGCTCLVHCAAGGSDLAESRLVNVEGTRALMRAFADAGGTRVVHVSSVAVHGTNGLPRLVTEEQPLVADGSEYEVSKAEGERAALAIGADLGLEVVVVRPTLVYGPGSRQWTLGFLDRVRYESVRLLGGGRGAANLIYIDDLCGLLIGGLMADSRAAGSAYFASGPDVVTWREFLGAYACMLGKPEPAMVPAALTRLAFQAALLRHKAVLRPLVISPFDTVGQFQSAVFSIEKARTQLAYAPGYPFEKGMTATVEWLVARGHLPGSSVGNYARALERGRARIDG